MSGTTQITVYANVYEKFDKFTFTGFVQKVEVTNIGSLIIEYLNEDKQSIACFAPHKWTFYELKEV